MALSFRYRIAFTTDPFSVSPSYTDVSGSILSSEDLQITFGQGDLDATVNPSGASFTADNHDGQFTVGYSGGSHFPNMLRGRRIHIDASLDGITYHDRFDGYLDTVPLQWSPSGRWATSQITCVDLLKVLDRRILTDNIVSLYYNQDSPTDYWDLGDPDGTIVPRNRTGTTELRADTTLFSANQSVTWGNGTGVGTDGLSALQIIDTDLVGTKSPGYLASNGWTVEGFFRGDGAVNTDDFRIAELYSADLAPSFYKFAVSISGGVGRAYFTDGTLNPNIIATGTTNLLDGSTHHVAGVWDGTTLTVYVDGVAEGTNTPGIFVFPTTPLYIYRVATSSVVHANPPTVTYSHIAVTASAVAAGDILNHALSGVTGFEGETSAQRFTRIAALAGVTPVVTGTSGTQSMGKLTDVEGSSVLSLLQAVQDTENGAMYVDTAGKLTLKPRTAFYNLAATLTLIAGQYDNDLTFVADDSRLINDAVVTSANGTVQEVTNATSITANGTYSVQKTLNTTSDAEALSWAQWQVNMVSTQAMRSPQVTIDLLSNQSLLPTAWTLLPGLRFDVTQLPSGSAPSTSVQLAVAGYTETYNGGSDTSPGYYTLQVNTDTFITGNLFTFNDSTLGKFNTGGVFAY